METNRLGCGMTPSFTSGDSGKEFRSLFQYELSGSICPAALAM
jgi:hypothetical protein